MGWSDISAFKLMGWSDIQPNLQPTDVIDMVNTHRW